MSSAPRNGKLFFRLSPGSRKRPLPSNPRSAEFNSAYHAALADVGEQSDIDDWTELRELHDAQRRAKDATMSDTARVARDLAACARMVLLDDPALDPVIVPLFERLECDLRMLRARDRVLAGLA
jgi:hypothetical protein